MNIINTGKLTLHTLQVLISTCCSPHCNKGLSHAISVAVLGDVDHSKVFADLDNHMLEMAVNNENHTFSLIKVIAICYC